MDGDEPRFDILDARDLTRRELQRVGGSFALVSSTTSQPATQPDSALND